MQPAEVDKLLSEYPSNKARYNHLYLEAMDMAIQINAETRRALANDAIQAQQYRDTPPSGKVSKPVEELALRYVDGYIPDTLAGWMKESEEMWSELRSLDISITYVDTWLEGLSDKERSVIVAHEIDQKSWSEIASTSAKTFGYHVGVSNLQKIKRKAIQKIYAIAR